MDKKDKLIYIKTISGLIVDVILAIFLLVLFVMSLYFVYLG